MFKAMKKFNYYLAYPLLMLLIFGSCNKDNITETDDQLGISKITRYPTFTMNGDRYVVLKPGDNYTEAGATAKEGTADIPVTIEGSVDTNTPGVYTITYSAVNKDGFAASVMRTVVVASVAADAAAHDLSGDYLRSNGQIATWTRIAPGVYTVFNPGGAAGTVLTLVAINPSGYELLVPLQTGSDGSEYDVEEEAYLPGPPAQFSWKIINPGYGTAVRTFVKQ